MIPYQWTSAALALTIAAVIVWLVRSNQLHARNATWWIALACVIAVTGVFPGMVDWVAALFGIHYAPIFAVLLALAVVVFKLLRADIERSREQQQLRILAQKVAVLEALLESEARDDASGDGDSTPAGSTASAGGRRDC